MKSGDRKTREMPPPLELECLKALWTLGACNVKDVQTLLSEDRELAYTTVMTLLDRLVRRGGASRRKEGRAFVYSALVTREQLRQIAVDSLVKTFFDNSREDLLRYLNGGAARPERNEYEDSLDASLL